MIITGYILLICGVLFILSGLIGLFRFPDFYTKIHAAGVLECAGAPMFLIGLACLQDNYTSSFKLLIAALLILLLNPVSTHALCRAGVAALHRLKGG